MRQPAQRALCLPEEFLLLAYPLTSEVGEIERIEIGCAAAELAELALRRKLAVRARKLRIFGFEAYAHVGRLRLLDTEPTGLAWADGLLTDLTTIAQPQGHSRSGSLSVKRWVSYRRQDAYRLHRSTLEAEGLLLPSPWRPDERLLPYLDTHYALAGELRETFSGDRPFDERLRLLGDLVDGADLLDKLQLTMPTRLKLDWARSRGPMAAIPEEIRDTATVLRFTFPPRRNGDGGGGGGDDGGDGE